MDMQIWSVLTSSFIVWTMDSLSTVQAVFLEYERESYERLTASIDALPSKSVQEVLKSFLGKIYKRQK